MSSNTNTNANAQRPDLMNNTPEQIERFEIFRTGWRRRSALHLDYCGVPYEIVTRRCPSPQGWGLLLYALSDLAMFGTLSDETEELIDRL